MSDTENTIVDYVVVDERSTVKLAGRSSLHPIVGKLRPGELAGSLHVEVSDGRVQPGPGTTAHLQFPILGLSFGNPLYDRELPKRVDADQYPLITVDLDGVTAQDAEHWRVRLRVGVHGAEREIEKIVSVTQPDDVSICLTGTHHFDIGEFGMQPPPKKLGMKVYPDFDVSLEIVGRVDGSPG